MHPHSSLKLQSRCSFLAPAKPLTEHTTRGPRMLYLPEGPRLLRERYKVVERGTRIARVVAASILLSFLAALAGCVPGEGPHPPTPIATNGATPTIISIRTGTPTPAVRPSFLRPLRSNPLVRTRAGDLVAPLRTVVDGTYCTPAWRSSDFPATLALPVEPVRGNLLLQWNSSGTSDFISPLDAPTYGIPQSYTIATSADSTDGTDGTWTEVVSVTGNSARTRAHRFPYADARWVRMTVTSAVPGPLGNEFVIDEIDLHNASDGTDDSVFFLGDSITAAAFARCPANQPSFSALVHRATPGRFPLMMDGGVNGVNIGYAVSVIEEWLSLNTDFNIWAIGYGTNDAWQKVSPSLFETRLQTLVDRIVEEGRIPVIARIPYAARGPADADVRALNRAVDRVTARNGLLPGPDLYAWFKAHPDELGPDGVHPSEAGLRSINRLWYEALRPIYDIRR
jgi:lysophospholipase L1-like esterase